MATITRTWNTIVIVSDIATNPISISNWENFTISSQEPDQIRLEINGKQFSFGPPSVSAHGYLTAVNGVSVTSLDAIEIEELILGSVLTGPDQFSGDATNITGTTMVAGQFLCLQVLTAAQFDVSGPTATIEVDGEGTAQSMAAYSGVTFAVGALIYGRFTQVQLLSGSVRGYSNR